MPKDTTSDLDLQAPLGQVAAAFKRHISAKLHEIHILALYVAYCHCWRHFYFAPRLSLWSATPGSGKSTVLEMLEVLIPEARNWSSVTASVLIRMAALKKYVFLLDEFDKYVDKDQEIIGCLNAGHKRNGKFPRSESDGKGGWTPKEYPVWAPVVYAAKDRKPPADLISRSIPIVMERAMPGQVEEPYSASRHEKKLKDLRGRLEAGLKQVMLVEPDQPEWLVGRDWDNWAPLWAIAATAGPEWLSKVEEAAGIVVKRALKDLDINERLLHDIYGVFEGRAAVDYPNDPDKAARIHSDSLVKKLNDDEDLPWGGLNNGKGLESRGLAARLAKFGITPEKTPFRIAGGGPLGRGYSRARFEEPWKRYGIGNGDRNVPSSSK